MSQPAADLYRTPLLERVVDLRLQEDASALASLQALVSDPDEGPTLPLCLELMAEVSSLVFPHHRLVRLHHAALQTRRGPVGPRPLVCHARKTSAGLEVRLEQPREGGAPQLVASATVELANTPQPAPTLSTGDDWALDRRGRPLNGDALYAAAELQRVSKVEPARVVRWATATGLGHLVGGLGPRAPLFGTSPSSTPLYSSPGVIEALCHMVEWQWYALSGEGGRVQGAARIEWYRIPRADEDLIGHVTSRGSVGGLPSFDAVAFGSDRKPALELIGLTLSPMALPGERRGPPRLEWQSFVRLLGGLGQTPGQ